MVLLMALLPCLIGCVEPIGRDDEPPRPPLRIDLTEALPRVEAAGAEGAELDQVIEPVVLATREEPQVAGTPHPVTVLDRAFGEGLQNPRHPQRYDLRLAEKSRTIEHPAELRLIWTLDIPPDALLTFRPALPTRPECVATYRLAVRTAQAVGEEARDEDARYVFERAVFGPPLWESAEESVDLSSWSGRDVELIASGRLESAAEATSGICDDEVLGWASPVIWSSARVAGRNRRRPSVIFLGLDTVRADRIGAWGRTPSPTPALDRLATESDVFLQAYSAFNVTNPSFVSLHTGLYGKNHGVYELDVPLARDGVTWAELFKEQGYATQAVLGATHLHDQASGLGQGFDGVHIPWGQFAAEEVVRRGLRWLSGLEEMQVPFFLWLHFFDAHTPHLPPMPYALGKAPAESPGLTPVARWLDLRPEGLLEHVDLGLGAHPDSYDDGLAYLDRQLGRLLDALDRRGLLENTWIVVVSDHGENLTEHDLLCRHAGLFDTTLHVPLMIRPPGPRGRYAGRRFDELVQTLDLFPTVLNAVGIEPPPSDGRDLYRIVESGGRPAVFAEHAHATGAAVRTTRYLYYRQDQADEVTAGVRLFDLEADPLQLDNLAGTGLDVESELATRLDQWLRDRRGDGLAGSAAQLSDEEESQLKALGYIDP